MKLLSITRFATALAGLSLFISSAAWSQDNYPSRSVRILVPTAAGGSLDLFARLIGQKLQERLGQPFIADNRPGGGTTVAAQAVASAPADGYTLLLSNTASNGAAPYVVKSAHYDPVKDFTHIAMVATANLVLVASPKSNIRTLDDVVKAGKEKNGVDVAISAVGGTSHLAGLRFERMAGLKLNHIPYRGSGPAQIAILAGDVPLMVDAVLSWLPHIKSSGVRPIAVLSEQRDLAP